ncbi:hypothetical protein GQ44DRAFT_561182, partial [Phaeosphaeriaceae sp. PMI808]
KLPYVKGFRMTAVAHKPPEPFDDDYKTPTPQIRGNSDEQSQLDYCLSNSSMEGRIIDGTSQDLIITAIIRTGYSRGAQLVEVNNNRVAKLYDPLYYPRFNDYGGQEDVVRNAIGDYSREAAAYEVLRKSPTACAVTPTFFGAWSTGISTKIGKTDDQTYHTRQVQLILIERLHGECMGWMIPKYMRKAVRSIILRKTLYAEAVILQAGVIHGDLAPRNVMVLGSNYNDEDLPLRDIKVEVKLVDFNAAAIIYHQNYKRRLAFEAFGSEEWMKKLCSPIIRYSGRMMEFSGEGWCSNEDTLPERWLWKHFHTDPRFLSVVWDPLDPYIRPHY